MSWMSVPTIDRRIRLAIVLATDKDTCTVAANGERIQVRYPSFFPRPRAERVAPGQLVALTAATTGGDRIVWRWFDAVVLECTEGGFRLWEPGHGEVLAQPRRAAWSPEPGSRVYASAGLPGSIEPPPSPPIKPRSARPAKISKHHCHRVRGFMFLTGRARITAPFCLDNCPSTVDNDAPSARLSAPYRPRTRRIPWSISSMR